MMHKHDRIVAEPELTLRPVPVIMTRQFKDSQNSRPSDMMRQDFPTTKSRYQDCPMAARVLVVDDEPMVRALIARVLTDEGYEVVAVANGRAALDAARGAAVSFDLIISNNCRRTCPQSTSRSALPA